jgi:Xaa-Pro aminopeptidase
MAAVRRLVAGKDWNGLLVTHMPNVFYLSGFSGSAGALLVEEGRSTLFVDGRYSVQAARQAQGCRVRVAPGGALDGACEALRARRGMVVALEAQHITLSQRRALGRRTRGGAVSRWVSAEGVVEGLRARKDVLEIQAMRAAARLGTRVFNQMIGFIRPGVRELDLAAEIEYRMKREGASGAAFETIVASGPRSALPHARPTARKLRVGELVVLDMGAILGHYCCDLTRTVYLGRPPSKARQWHDAVRESHAAAVARLRPGVTAGQVDEAARSALRKHRLDRWFIHSTGHGLGIEVHEEPRLARGAKAILQEGNVVTIEPGVYREGYGGIRIEDDYLITARGAERLTKDCEDVFAI